MLEATPETLIFSTSSKFLFSWQFLFSFGYAILIIYVWKELWNCCWSSELPEDLRERE